MSTKSALRRPPAGGFSLVEMMVVVMVILVIAAIAIPNMLQARMRANEAAAAASMNTIHTAEALYIDAYPRVGFASNLADLGSHGSNCETPSQTNSCILRDDALTSGLKNGYMFEVVGDGNVPDARYALTAVPESAGHSGRCTYTSDETGQIQSTPAVLPKATRFSMGGNTVCGS